MTKTYLPYGAARDEITMRFVKLDRDNDRRKLYRRFKKRDKRDAMKQAEQDILDHQSELAEQQLYYNDMSEEEYEVYSDWLEADDCSEDDVNEDYPYYYDPDPYYYDPDPDPYE